MEAILESNRIVIESKCSICTEPMLNASSSSGDVTIKLVKLPQCVHCFHHSCIKEWFESCKQKKSSLSCPICRVKMVLPVVPPVKPTKKRAREYVSLEETKAMYKRMCPADKDQMTYYTAGKYADTITPEGIVCSYSDDSGDGAASGNASGDESDWEGWGSS